MSIIKKTVVYFVVISLFVCCSAMTVFASYSEFEFVPSIEVRNSGEWVDGVSTYYRTANTGAYNIGTPGGEAGQVFEETKVLAGDYIVRESGGKFGNNVGANNMFYWREPGSSAGSMNLVKQYGGYDGYYGYVANGDICVNYSNQTHKFIRPNNAVDPETVAGNNNKRGVLELSARDGHAVSFGKYDLDLSKSSVFKARIQGFNQMPKVVLQIVQGKEDNSDVCEKTADILEWNSVGEMRTPASSQPFATNCGFMENSGNFSFENNKYYDVFVIIDTESSIPTVSLKVVYVGNNENTVIADLPERNLAPDGNGKFDFLSDMGIRFKVQKSGGGGQESTLHIKSMSLKPYVTLKLLTSEDEISSKRISADGTGTQTFIFNNTLDEMSISSRSIRVVDDDGTSYRVKAKVSDNTLTVMYPKLDFNKGYKIVFSGIKDIDGNEFNNEYNIFTVEGIEITNAKSEDSANGLKISFDITNNNETGYDAIVFVTAEKDGKTYPGVFYKKIALTGNDNLPVTVNLSGEEKSLGKKYKIHVLSDLNALTNAVEVG